MSFHLPHLFAGLTHFLPILGLVLCGSLHAQNTVIRLHDGPAPGSEKWTHQEKELAKAEWGTGPFVYNVVNPTLTVFRPDPQVANGAAVVICPGGAMFFLSVRSEGSEVAQWLNQKGVTCFVLRYRLVECKSDNPIQELQARGKLEPVVAPVVPLAMADGQEAIRYIRTHAKEFGVDPHRIGIIGFSAGGAVSTSVAYNYTTETRPDFVASIYPAYSWAVRGNGVPADAPPLFVLTATDDPLGLGPQSVLLYQEWTQAKRPAELHMFSKGGHGFGMNHQNLPTDQWIERFHDWMGMLGMTKR